MDNIIDVGLTCINILLAIISGVGACKSVKYFRKSKNLTILAKTNKALSEIEKMFSKLPKILEVFRTSNRNIRGYNLEYTLSKIGCDLNTSLINIMSQIPIEYSSKLRELQNSDDFDLQIYCELPEKVPPKQK